MAPEISESLGSLQQLLEMRGMSCFLLLKIKNINSEIEEYHTHL